MLTYRKPVECCGFEAVIVISEDGKLEIEGYDPDYEVAFAAMGGSGKSICREVIEGWEEPIAVICESLADDVRVPLSLAADAIMCAHEAFIARRAPVKTQDEDEHYITDAVSFTRDLVELKTNPPPDHDSFWDTYDILEEEAKIARIEGKCFVQNSVDYMKRRNLRGGLKRILEQRALSSLFYAAGYLSRAASGAIRIKIHPDAATAELERAGYNSILVIHEACWSIAFSTSKNDTEAKERFGEARRWVIARFVNQMRYFDATGEWK